MQIHLIHTHRGLQGSGQTPHRLGHTEEEVSLVLHLIHTHRGLQGSGQTPHRLGHTEEEISLVLHLSKEKEWNENVNQDSKK